MISKYYNIIYNYFKKDNNEDTDKNDLYHSPVKNYTYREFISSDCDKLPTSPITPPLLSSKPFILPTIFTKFK
jgi:hypothetical protein